MTPVDVTAAASEPQNHVAMFAAIRSTIHNGVRGGSQKLRSFVRNGLAQRSTYVSPYTARYLADEINYLLNHSAGKIAARRAFPLSRKAGSTPPKITSEESTAREATAGQPLKAPKTFQGSSGQSVSRPLPRTSPQHSSEGQEPEGKLKDIASVEERWIVATLNAAKKSNGPLKYLTREDLKHLFTVEGAYKRGKFRWTHSGGDGGNYVGPFQMGKDFWNDGANRLGLQKYYSTSALKAAGAASLGPGDVRYAPRVWVAVVNSYLAPYSKIYQGLSRDGRKRLIYLVHNLGPGHARVIMGIARDNKQRDKGQAVFAFLRQCSTGKDFGKAIRSHSDLFRELGYAHGDELMRRVKAFAGPHARSEFAHILRRVS